MSNTATAKVPAPSEDARRSRSPQLIDQVRLSHAATAGGLPQVSIYMPRSLMRLVKLAAIDRDSVLRMLSESGSEPSEWPGDVVPISGASGVIAQVLSDHFAATTTAVSERGPATAATAKPPRSRRRAS